MKYELIITEKPNSAKMIAQALADGKPIKESVQGVPYYKLTHGNHDIVVGCAVGHLYTVAEKDKSFKYPSFDLEWKQTSDVDKKSFTKKYVTVLKKIAKDAGSFTVATDYDIEGEVIGLNVVRYICKQKDASRMKFSTLTKPDLIESYAHKSKTLDWGQAYAGETRHYLDWMYGINLSRALTLAIRSTGAFKIMSSGRVQGPALKLIVDLEDEIASFKPVPYWEIEVEGSVRGTKRVGKISRIVSDPSLGALSGASSSTAGDDGKDEIIDSWHSHGAFQDENEAIAVYEKVRGRDGKIDGVEKSEFSQRPPTPFDLTTLQTESYRLFGISPKVTLDIAQELYTSGYISYPRTSSQKLPKEIGYKKIIDGLAKNLEYKQLASRLSGKSLVPNEGKKSDPAHPAIYPTGVHASLKDRQQKVYDLIVKRFFACFAEDAKRETVAITILIDGERFISKGIRTIYTGWHEFYAPYVRLEEEELPAVKQGDVFTNKNTLKHDKQTQPPRRYTQASLIRELERRELGTKATRAQVIESLYDRNYIKNDPIEATEFGIETVKVLGKYCPEIVEEQLTRHFEEEMEIIREKKLAESRVIDEAKQALTSLLEKFKKNEKKIGSGLLGSYKKALDTQSYIGKCPKCETGNLRITYSKKSKRRFIACDNYPNCKTILNMPYGKIKITEKKCDKCGFPMIQLINKRRFQELCLNSECPSKNNHDTETLMQIKAIESGKLEKKCPKCGKNLVLRTSVYGQFLGCSGYPNCRYIESLKKKEDGSASKKQEESAATKSPAATESSTIKKDITRKDIELVKSAKQKSKARPKKKK